MSLKLILKLQRIKPVLYQMHWLPVQYSIQTFPPMLLAEIRRCILLTAHTTPEIYLC